MRVVDHEGNSNFIDDGGIGDMDGTQTPVIVLQLTAEPVFIEAIKGCSEWTKILQMSTNSSTAWAMKS